MSMKMPYGDRVKKGRSMKADKRESGLPAGGKRQKFAPPVYKDGMNKGTKPPVMEKGSEVRRRALLKKMSSM